MRLLLDQDVYAATEQFLILAGHDVVRAAAVGLSQAGDVEILQAAEAQGRILITRDRDFGNLVFVEALGSGVIYLRILPSVLNAVHSQLEAVLKTYSTQELARAFVVIEPSGHRIRRLSRE